METLNTLSHGDVVTLFLQLSLLLIAARVFAELARMLKQPAVVGEILAGIILGPTIFGMLAPDLFQSIFSTQSQSFLVLDGIVQMAVVLLLFIAGLEVELHIVWQQGKNALNIAMFSLIVPLILGFAATYFMPEFFGIGDPDSRLIFALFMGTAMSITALPVIARVLMDLQIFKTRMGLLVIASAMIIDILGWIIFSIILSMMGRSLEGVSLGATIGLTLGFTLMMLTLGKSLINQALPWINKKMAWPGGLLSLSMALCFLAAAFTEFIGIHAIFGAFIFGVALGDSKYMTERAKEILHQFINNIFAPLFFASIGLKVNFILGFDPLLVLAVLVLGFATKIIGSGLGALRAGFNQKESLAIGYAMNTRGAMEIILGLIALENEIINDSMFIALVVLALVTSMTSGPLMKKTLGLQTGKSGSS
jgi:Kef-type K+ transport system membrane component KefB